MTVGVGAPLSASPSIFAFLDALPYMLDRPAKVNRALTFCRRYSRQAQRMRLG